MNKKIVITLIVIWSCIAVFLGGILIYGIASDSVVLTSWLNRDEYCTKNMDEEESYTFNAQEINSIEVDLTSEDVSIIPTESKEIKIVYRESKSRNAKEKVIIKQENNTLKVYKDFSNNRNFSLGFFSDKRNFSFDFRYNNSTLDIYLPKQNKSNIKLALSSGDLKVESLVCNDLKIEQTSGNTQLNNLICLELEVDKSSGDIQLEEIKADKIKIESTSGNAACRDVDAQILEGESSSGDSEFENCAIGSLQYESTSGKIDVQGEYKDINLDSSSGNSKIELTTMPKRIKVYKTSGETTLYLPENEGFKLDYNKSSGDFDSEFELTGSIGEADHILAHYGNGKSIIEVESSSGNLNLKINK